MSPTGVMLCTSGWTCQAFTAPWGQVHGVDDLTERGACLEGTHAVFVGGPRSIRRALEVRMDLADRDRGLVLSLEHAEGGEHLRQHDVPFFDRPGCCGRYSHAGGPHPTNSGPDPMRIPVVYPICRGQAAIAAA